MTVAARQTYRDVVDDARAFLIDPSGTVFKDSVLVAIVNLAQRRVHMSLASVGAGQGFFLTNTATDIPITAVTQTTLDWTSASPLPNDLIVPLKLWEKPTGSTDDNYVEMTKVERLAQRTQDDRLIEWWWENNQIQFIGSTAARTIRMEYNMMLPKVSDLSVALPIPAEADALVFYTAYFCALGRGSLEQASAVKAEADYSLYLLANLSHKSAQESATRRLPYSAWPTTGGGRFV